MRRAATGERTICPTPMPMRAVPSARALFSREPLGHDGAHRRVGAADADAAAEPEVEVELPERVHPGEKHVAGRPQGHGDADGDADVEPVGQPAHDDADDAGDAHGQRHGSRRAARVQPNSAIRGLRKIPKQSWVPKEPTSRTSDARTMTQANRELSARSRVVSPPACSRTCLMLALWQQAANQQLSHLLRNGPCSRSRRRCLPDTVPSP